MSQVTRQICRNMSDDAPFELESSFQLFMWLLETSRYETVVALGGGSTSSNGLRMRLAAPAPSAVARVES